MAEEAQTYQPDGYGDTYQGMDFDTFRALDDETVGRLRAAHNEAVIRRRSCPKLPTAL